MTLLAAALRGRGARRGRHHRPHHLHAHRLGPALAGGGPGACGRTSGRRYGKDYLPEEPIVFKTKQKQAQEAHEAVRPTSLDVPAGEGGASPRRAGRAGHEPALRAHLEPLRRLPDGAGRLRPDHGRRPGRPGHLPRHRLDPQVPRLPGGVRREAARRTRRGPRPRRRPTRARATRRRTGSLPPLEAGQDLRLVRLLPEQHFTQPPPRFNESSLIKELEEKGIGRPSTYASILSTIQDKGYVEKVERIFKPTHLGLVVTDELVKAFPSELDVAFTAGMEERLDEVEEGTAGWQAVLTEFYDRFKVDLAKAEERMRDVKAEQKPTERPLREVRQAHGHQVGAQRGVPGLPGLPGMPEHHELPARWGRRRPGQGGGGPHRREVPRVLRTHGDEAGPLREVLRMHPLSRLQGHEVGAAGRAVSQVRQRPLRAPLPPRARPSTAARHTPSATSSPGTGPGWRSARSARTRGWSRSTPRGTVPWWPARTRNAGTAGREATPIRGFRCNFQEESANAKSLQGPGRIPRPRGGGAGHGAVRLPGGMAEAEGEGEAAAAASAARPAASALVQRRAREPGRHLLLLGATTTATTGTATTPPTPAARAHG